MPLILTEREKRLMEKYGLDESDMRVVRRTLAADDHRREEAEERAALAQAKKEQDEDAEETEDIPIL